MNSSFNHPELINCEEARIINLVEGDFASSFFSSFPDATL